MLYVKIPPHATIIDKSFISVRDDSKGRTISYYEAKWSHGTQCFVVGSQERLELGSEGFVTIKDFKNVGNGFTLVHCRLTFATSEKFEK